MMIAVANTGATENGNTTAIPHNTAIPRHPDRLRDSLRVGLRRVRKLLRPELVIEPLPQEPAIHKFES